MTSEDLFLELLHFDPINLKRYNWIDTTDQFQLNLWSICGFFNIILKFFQLNASNIASEKDDELNDTFNITRKPPDFSDKTSADIETSASAADPLNATKTQTMSEAVLHDATL